MKWSVIAHVGGMNSGPPLDKHLNDFGVATFGCPMEWWKLVVISEGKKMVDRKFMTTVQMGEYGSLDIYA